MRLGETSYRILCHLSKAPGQHAYVSEIAQRLRSTSGPVSRALERMEGEGYVVSRLERGSPHKLKRPLRRYYAITKTGVKRIKGMKT